jgi:hypothetical protein
MSTDSGVTMGVPCYAALFQGVARLLESKSRPVSFAVSSPN